MITEQMIENARGQIEGAIKESETYLGTTDHWEISPTPAYFDSGEEPSFEICRARADGQTGEFIFIGTEWECYQMFVELFGDENVLRSSDYKYIW